MNFAESYAISEKRDACTDAFVKQKLLFVSLIESLTCSTEMSLYENSSKGEIHFNQLDIEFLNYEFVIRRSSR